MSYNCGWGCTSYNPSCDACDDATTSDNPYNHKEEEKQMLAAALQGMSWKEYLDAGCPEPEE